MISNLNFSYGEQFFILPVFSGEYQSKNVMEYHSFLHIPDNQVSCFLVEKAHIFTGKNLILPGFIFPNLIPGCSDNVFVLQSDYLPLFAPSVGFLSVLEFAQDLCSSLQSSWHFCLMLSWLRSITPDLRGGDP